MRRRRCFTLAAVLFSVALLVCFHQSLLTCALQRHVVEQSASHVDRVVVYGGEGRFDLAAEGIRAGTIDGILLLEDKATRPVRLGILPSTIAAARQSLTSRGIADESITDIRGTQRNQREAVLQLGDWLNGNPGVRVQFLCRRLESAAWRAEFDADLDASVANRIYVRGLPDRSYDEACWWRSRSGIRAVAVAYVGSLYSVLGDGEEVRRTAWDPDAFADALRTERPQ